MNALSFCFRKLKTIVCFPFFYIGSTSLEFEFNGFHIFRSYKYSKIVNKKRTINVFHTFNNVNILMPNKISDKMLLCGTPCSCLNMSNNVLPIRTLNVRSDKSFRIKSGNRPKRPNLCNSFMMPCFQVVSWAFSRLKNTATTCSF